MVGQAGVRELPCHSAVSSMSASYLYPSTLHGELQRPSRAREMAWHSYSPNRGFTHTAWTRARMSTTPNGSDPDEETRAPRDLEELLAAIEAIEAPSGRVYFEDILAAVGRRSFGPLLLLAGVVTLMPVISGIPGVPLLMACFTLLVCVQLLMGRRTFWLPAWLRRRWVSRHALHKGLGYLHRPARWVDHLLDQRLAFLTGQQGMQASALTCLLVAIGMPPMELIPFSANVAGLTLSLFGLALMSRDGLLSLLGFALAGTSLALVVIALL